MKRTVLRAAGVSILAAAAIGTVVPTAVAAGGGHAPGKFSTHAAKAVAKAPSVSVKKIFTGQGTVPSVIVTFDYSCNAATQRLDVTLTSFPPLPAGATYLKATKAEST
ncbi:hypothetical protein [Streptomyces cinnamoneus]|uniref:Uncharacterized protein n=1 Tax=Streptomyces cinnamoneus TaxID=53446 RepID=A0A918U289_STRCJ|nr:hypothetical protein [Streptomyces cinnamoneus]GHC73297.1 hypothetical protein GCM10010507_60630 [Streptomyces cinnamoneus]